MIVPRHRRWIAGLLAGAVLAIPEVTLAQEGGSKAVTQNAKGPAVAARAPGLRVRDAIGGPQIVQSRSESETITRQQGVMIDIINAIFLGLNQLVPLLPSIFGGVDGDVSGVGDLIITELANDGTNTFIEVLNPSSIRIELINWGFCKVDGCTGGGELAGLVMERDDVLVFQLSGQLDSEFANNVISLQVGTPVDDIGLYDFTGVDTRDPSDRVALRDYLQWGDVFESIGLEDLAVSAGLWVSGTSIEDTLANNSFQLQSGSLIIGGTAEDYVVVPFGQNSLGQVTPTELQTASTRTGQ